MMDFIWELIKTNSMFESELADRKGELNMIIQDWINVSYSLFKELLMNDEINIYQ